MMKAPTERFSDRVDDYVRFRPGYPPILIETLIRKCCLNQHSIVADIGSGTGILSRQLLDRHLSVIAVEPNSEMRLAAESMLSAYDGYTSIRGSAEDTHLADKSIDVITAAQSFHWFKQDASYVEFARILKEGGRVALIWNRRNLHQAFQRDYDALLSEKAPEYDLVNHMNIADKEIADFFSPKAYETHTFENRQSLDRTSFLGRLKSASYLPPADSTEYAVLMERADQLFSEYAAGGRVFFEYDACLYIGQL